MTGSYDPAKWSEDRLLVALLVSKGKYREAHMMLTAISMAADPGTAAFYASGGMLLVLEILRPESRERA